MAKLDMHLFGKDAVGLDIDDRSIEVAHIKKQGKRFKVISLGRTNLERGIVENGRIKQLGPLVSAIKETMAKAKPLPIKCKNLVLGLPVNQVYSVVAVLPNDVADRNIAIMAEAKKNVPLSDDDLLVVSKNLELTEAGQEVLITASSKKVIEEWKAVLDKLKADAKFLDIELYALFRNLKLAIEDNEAPTCLVDIGSQTTNIIIFHQGTVRYTCSLKFAGDRFTTTIADKYKLDFNIAEVKKIRLGLNRQLFPVLEADLAEISTEIKRVLNYYHQKTSQTINEVVLVGGSSRLKGLVAYLRDSLSVTVNFGQSLAVPGDYPEYIGAIGFALKKIDDDWQNDPIFSFDKLADNKWLSEATEDLKPSKKPNKSLSRLSTVSTVEKNTKLKENFGPIADLSAYTDVQNDLDANAKLAYEKKVLLTILLLGLPLIGGAYWYREQNRLKQSSVAVTNTPESFSQVQAIPFKLRLYLKDNLLPDGIKGRIIEDKVDQVSTYTEMEADSFKRVSQALVSGESLWKQPVNEILNKENLKSPVTFRWLAYSDKEMLTKVLSALELKGVNKSSYSFTSWTRDNLEKIDTFEKVIISGTLNIAVSQTINLPSLDLTAAPGTSTTTAATVVSATSTAATSSLPSTPQTPTASVSNTPSLIGQTVTIKQTETGWLNVRQGPGPSNAIITKINPGESYQVIASQGTWTKLQLTGETAGWVSTKYLDF